MARKAQTIFIQIASYRDPQLVPTIEDMLRNAKRPQNLSIGICRQYHPDDEFDNLDQYSSDKRFKIIDVLYNETKGACWARHQVQQLYEGEMYTLQLDSHMRFVKNWDTILIAMLRQLQDAGYPKPLLTAYAPSYDPANDPAGRKQEPWRMNFDRFIPEGAVFFIPETIPNWEAIDAPVPARFYSAHMTFTLGEFSTEVQHNPEYYFHGEEISITVRAYTHGYDLFHPHRAVIWHEYTRKGRTKQWDDDKEWVNKNVKSHLTNRKLFGMDGETQEGHEGEYGFGTVRTLEDYEKYAGLSFVKRAIQQYTMDKKYPPNPGPNELGGVQAWKDSFIPIFKHCIDIDRGDVSENDYDFWAVAFHDKHDNTMYRRDADKAEIERMMNDADGYCKVWREFQTETKPDYWVVWPHSESKDWCPRLTGKL
ncbi:MAG: GlcNAc-transferase family protein [Saprospiraceae bacterium]